MVFKAVSADDITKWVSVNRTEENKDWTTGTPILELESRKGVK